MVAEKSFTEVSMSELTQARRKFLRPFVVAVVVGALILWAKAAFAQTSAKAKKGPHKPNSTYVRKACGKVVEFADGPIDTSSVKILKVLFVSKDTLEEVAWDTSDKTKPVFIGKSYWFFFDKNDEAIDRELVYFNKPCPLESRS